MKFQNSKIKEENLQGFQSKTKKITKEKVTQKVQNQTDIMQHQTVEYKGAMSSKF